MHQISKAEQLRQVISAEQIQKRVKEIARQISDDYRGQTIHAMALLDNGFMFMADLVRSLDVPVVCQFIKPRYQKQQGDGPGEVLEIFFSHGGDIRGQRPFDRRPDSFRSDHRIPDVRSSRPGSSQRQSSYL